MLPGQQEQQLLFTDLGKASCHGSWSKETSCSNTRLQTTLQLRLEQRRRRTCALALRAIAVHAGCMEFSVFDANLPAALELAQLRDQASFKRQAYRGRPGFMLSILVEQSESYNQHTELGTRKQTVVMLRACRLI